MTPNGLRRVLLQIGLGYTNTLRRLTWILALALATVVVSAVIVFPLWYFSTHDRPAYTATVLSLAGAGVLYLIIRKSWTFWELPRGERALRIRRLLAKLAAILGYLAGLYIILGLYLVGLFVAAIPLSALYLLALGYTLYVRRSRVRG